MNYEHQFVRITNAGRLTDRFLNCQHLEPPEILQSSMGEVFSLIEIISPWFPSAQVGQSIIKNFSECYFRGGSTSDLINFENSLKKVNENLAQITQNGETEWIGNLNGILAAIVDNNLHLTSTGSTEAYIFRDGKINHVTQGLSSVGELHPLKTFTNVVSGQLKANDKVLITNKSLFEFLSLDSVRQIISLSNPSNAAYQITKLLRKAKTKNVNLIIISIFSKDDISKEPLGEKEVSVFYLDKSTESVFGKLGDFWQNILSPFAKIIRSKVKSTATGGKKTFKNVFKTKKTSENEPEPQKESEPHDNFHKEFLSKEARDDNLLKDEEIKYSPDLYVHYYQEKKSQKPNRLKSIFKTILTGLKTFFGWISTIYNDKAKRKYLFIAIAIILILIIILSTTFRGKQNKIGNLESQKILDEAIAAQKDAKDSLSAGNQDKAKSQFVISIQKAQSIKDVSQVSKDAQNVLSGSYQELDKLTSTTRFEKLDPIVTLDENAKGLFVVSGQAYILTENDVWKASVLGGRPEKITSLPKNKGNFINGTNLGNVIYLYTNNQNLLEFDPSTNKIDIVKTSEDGRWETANSIAGFVGSLYFLDGVVGQIYKHTSNTSTFDKGEEYLSASNNSLKSSVSLAIDGSIYALKNDGKLSKFQKSKLQDFSLKNLPSPYDQITDPRKVYTDSDTPSLYILDNGQKRIIQFDKDGYFVHQFALPDSFDKITDFQVSVKSKKIWILNAGSLYEISI